ncbi:COX15/CtaA family protein [Pontibacter ramchanderi]|uniref:Cytochrome c oxidase assembly protein subunit 15 n=1 Tax=Pontibacter ramchanderi TaxID=1179743 RepID=A0A2N3V0Q2_9BACT|nr:COX15/CtaA family protein [Pontibacter ramchanderi]PKV75185.1 cytochrome c oxidase assembly protein subunit 15 [Pontibacter ramchanderi]
MRQQPASLPVIIWLISGIVLVVAMVIIGGITRLTGSGLSITEWNLISGTLPPLSESEWLVMFDKYKQFPEYQKLNFGMTLSGFKQIFMWEYLHRLLGRIIGVVFIVPFLYFLYRKMLAPWLVKRLIFILLLGMAQGLMGWVMVMSGLSEMPHVSHYRLAAHLSLALFLVGVILWTVADLMTPAHGKAPTKRPAYTLSWLVLGAVLVQIVLGAFVAGLKSGFSYNTWPLMQGEFFPETLQGVPVFGYFKNGVAVQFLHRWFALVALAGIVALWYKVRQRSTHRGARQLTNLLLLTGIGQVVLGIITLLLVVPVSLGVLHQLVAVALFSLAVLAVHQLRQPAPIKAAHATSAPYQLV